MNFQIVIPWQYARVYQTLFTVVPLAPFLFAPSLIYYWIFSYIAYCFLIVSKLYSILHRTCTHCTHYHYYLWYKTKTEMIENQHKLDNSMARKKIHKKEKERIEYESKHAHTYTQQLTRANRHYNMTNKKKSKAILKRNATHTHTQKCNIRVDHIIR